MASEELKAAIELVCAERQEIAACYLFGSCANGRQRPDSDVDVAFLLDSSIPKGEYFDLKMTFHNRLAGLLRKEIHPVILNGAGEVLLEQVLGKGILLFVRDELQLSRFRAIAFSMIADFAPYRNAMEDALLRKLKEEPSDG
ncbi:type VII toxin-antitoxin system MntA family adenylyltransferase antitoxin [Geomesophilobacter sediminis]|uniref:Nucleotidyltransferase domain-containing protein n=1 Tax=Geomesophilobacter sediminis TaxID=2798584 RepID=A0A8J7IWF9_9BACT|nr:nucleotidyltransferase domain-containing protein [Geomesophilobacter sediminis]MBJ6723827.1 nucleotidyltransferase domain-containing protein [Geomesophilobacter sediminis]